MGGAIAELTGAAEKQRRQQETEMQVSAAKQAADAEALRKQMLEQPKKVAPDDILASKNKMLNTMRMGMASTMTAAGLGVGVGGKQKLGQ